MRPRTRKARQLISTTPIGDSYEQLGYVPASSASSRTADIGFVVGRFRGPTFTGVELAAATLQVAVARRLRLPRHQPAHPRL